MRLGASLFPRKRKRKRESSGRGESLSRMDRRNAKVEQKSNALVKGRDCMPLRVAIGIVRACFYVINYDKSVDCYW